MGGAWNLTCSRPEVSYRQPGQERKRTQRVEMELVTECVCAHSPFLRALQKELLVGGDELELGGFLSDPLQPLPH